MALNPHLSNTGANKAADQVCALLNSGYLDILDGTQPATADTAITTQTVLASLRFNASAFGAASAGVAAANAITSAVASASSTATWFRLYESDHTTVIADGSVGATGSGCDLELATATIVAGGTVSVSSFTFTQSKT